MVDEKKIVIENIEDMTITRTINNQTKHTEEEERRIK